MSFSNCLILLFCDYKRNYTWAKASDVTPGAILMTWNCESLNVFPGNEALKWVKRLFEQERLLVSFELLWRK
jgi:hypothetical protein